jgi:hypothetical protein
MPEMINKRNVRICLLFVTLGFYVVMFAQDQTVKTQQDFDQKAALAKLREQIKGRENEPAEQVFKNIQTLKGVPAGRLLAIMAGGYARSLGVDCTHCHVPEKWEADDKRTKPIAREMAAMTRTINNELLKNIKNLNSATPTINCTTCHRGQVTPALNLPTPSPSPAAANTAVSNH